LERPLAGRELALDRTAYIAWLITIGHCLCFLAFQPQLSSSKLVAARLPLVATAIGFALHAIVCAIARARDGPDGDARVHRFLWASMPMSLLPAVIPLHQEIYLQLNNAGIVGGPGPLVIQALLGCALGAWMLVRWFRSARTRPFRDARWLDRLVGWRCFPL